jgi:dihydroorotate dehydrogenase electron transfer subunit
VKPGERGTLAFARPAVLRAGIIAQRRLGEGIHWLEVALPAAWGPPRPGQFVSLAVDPVLREGEPGCCGSGLVRRPFSIAGYERLDGHARLALLYSPIGRVTRRMLALQPGEDLDLLGPLGSAFPLDAEGAPYHLVGGGRGIAPLLFVAGALGRANLPYTLYYGTRTACEAMPLEALPRAAVRQATDDGSLGARGTVIELLDHAAPAQGTILACGPNRMLSALAQWAGPRGLPCWVSIEEHFGCGLGTCGGCAVPAVDPPGSYLWACRDGAVLAAGSLDWNRWIRAAAPPATSRDPWCGGEEV